MTVFSREQKTVILKQSFRDVLYREGGPGIWRRGLSPLLKVTEFDGRAMAQRTDRAPAFGPELGWVPAHSLPVFLTQRRGEVSIHTSVILTTP